MSRLPAHEGQVIGPDTVHSQGVDINQAHPDPRDVVDSFDAKNSTASDSPQIVKRRGKGPLLISSISKDEPLVTRKELWSYYCMSLVVVVTYFAHGFIRKIVYYNGDNVRSNCEQTDLTSLRLIHVGCWSPRFLNDTVPGPRNVCRIRSYHRTWVLVHPVRAVCCSLDGWH